MGIANYISRNPSEPAKPPNEYDKNFIIATIDIIREKIYIIRKRGRPRKQQIQQPTNTYVERSNNSNKSKNYTRESPDDSKNTTTNEKNKRQRGRPRKATKEIQLDYKKSQDISQKQVTKTIKPYTESNYNLRSAQNANKTEINITKHDVRANRLFAHNTITQAHLPLNTPSTQQPNSSKYKISKQQMDNSNKDQPNRTTGSPSPRKAFSMSNYLSPTHKQPASEKDERDDQLPKPLEDIFNTQLIVL